MAILLNGSCGFWIVSGKFTSGKWAKIGKCSTDTALNDIRDLVNKGLMKKNDEGGRSTNYSLVLEPSDNG